MRMRIVIEVDTEMPRKEFNKSVNQMVLAAFGTFLVYLSTEEVDTQIMYDKCHVD